MEQKQPSNYPFYLFSLLLIGVTIFNFTTIFSLATGETDYGTQVGGTIIAVSMAGCQVTPPLGTGLDPVCVTAQCTPAFPVMNNGVTITPYGYSATGICPAMAMTTTSGPLSVASAGMQILGLFTTPVFPGPSIPIGLIGTSF